MNAVQPQENWKTDSNYNINTQGTDQVKYTTFITHNHGSTQVCNNCKRETMISMHERELGNGKKKAKNLYRNTQGTNRYVNKTND